MKKDVLSQNFIIVQPLLEPLSLSDAPRKVPILPEITLLHSDNQCKRVACRLGITAIGHLF